MNSGVVKYVYSRLYSLANAEPTTDPAKLEERENQKALYKLILEFGANAQTVLGYRTDELATDPHAIVIIDGGTLANGFASDVFVIGAEVTVTADPARSFTGWTDGNGNLVSTDATYTFELTESIKLVAGYAD